MRRHPTPWFAKGSPAPSSRVVADAVDHLPSVDGSPNGGVVRIPEIRRPILVTGSHRSGTTWIASMLSAGQTRPVHLIDEPFGLRHRPGIFTARMPCWFPYVCDDNGWLVEEAYRRTLALRYDPVAELSSLRTARDVGRLGRDWFRFERARRNRSIPLVKDPIAVFSAPWLARRFDMQVVVTIRHPAAFAYSLKRLGWTHPFSHFLRQPLLMRDHLGSVEEQIRRFATAERPIIEQAALLWRSIYTAVDGYRERHPDWIYVRHEDVAADPLGWFASLYEQLGLPFDASARSVVRKHCSTTNPEGSARPNEVRLNSVAAATKWRTKLTEAEVDTIRSLVGDIADAFYDADGWRPKAAV